MFFKNDILLYDNKIAAKIQHKDDGETTFQLAIVTPITAQLFAYYF